MTAEVQAGVSIAKEVADVLGGGLVGNVYDGVKQRELRYRYTQAKVDEEETRAAFAPAREQAELDRMAADTRKAAADATAVEEDNAERRSEREIRNMLARQALIDGLHLQGYSPEQVAVILGVTSSRDLEAFSNVSALEIPSAGS